MKNLIRSASAHPVLSNLMMVALLLGGVIAALNLRKEMFPEFSLDRITIIVPYPHAQPEEVEEAICTKIEEAIDGIEGIKKINSIASENVGSVVVELDSKADSQTVLSEIKTKVDSISTFPEGAEKPVISELFRRDQVINLVVYGKAPEGSLKEIARKIKDELKALPDLTDVVWSGIREYEINIEVSEEALQKYGLTFEQVLEKVRKNSENIPGGTLKTNREEIRLQTTSRKYTGPEFENILLLTQPNGGAIYLRDVAKVVDGFEEDEHFDRFNGHRAVLIGVYKTEEQDAIQIAKKVVQYCEQRRDSLPKNIHLAIWSNRSKFIKQRLSMLTGNGKIGFVLVLLCLWFFLSLRLSFWVSMGIPVSFGGGLLILWIFNQSLNMVSMFALIMALGLVVDDAIVVGENIFSHREKGDSPGESSFLGAWEMAGPVFASVATTIIAFGPLFFVSGIMGKFIRQIPLAVTAILVASFLESIFILPAHLRHSPDPPTSGWSYAIRSRVNGLIKGLIHGLYKPVYYLSLKNKFFTLCLTLFFSMVAFGLVRGGFIQTIFFPKLDEEILIAKVTFPQGTPIEVTKRAVKKIEMAAEQLNQIFKKEDVPIQKQMLSTVGEVPGFSVTQGSNLGSVTLQLSDSEVRKTHSDQVLARWRKLTGDIPGTLSLTFGGRTHGPGGKPIEINLLSSDTHSLRQAARELKDELRKYTGVHDVEDDFSPGKKEINPQLKKQAYLLGLSDSDLGQSLFRAFAGREVMRLQRGADEVKIKVRYLSKDRKSLSFVESMRLRKQGWNIPFGEVARYSMRRAPAVIQREDRKRRLKVTADVNQFIAPAGKILQDLKNRFLPGLLQRYPHLSYRFAGQQDERKKSINSLKRGFIFALLGIFITLALVFRSYAQPLIIMAVIPFGVVGALFGHWILGYQLVIMSFFGIVALSGVVVNDSLVLIDRINVGLKNGATVMESVQVAGPARFRAIILTTITTFAGLTPLIMETSLQAQFLIPMAISLGFGLVFATFLTLFFVPCLFLYLNSFRRFGRWVFTGRWPTMEEVEPAYQKPLIEPTSKV